MTDGETSTPKIRNGFGIRKRQATGNPRNPQHPSISGLFSSASEREGGRSPGIVPSNGGLPGRVVPGSFELSPHRSLTPTGRRPPDLVRPGSGRCALRALRSSQDGPTRAARGAPFPQSRPVGAAPPEAQGPATAPAAALRTHFPANARTCPNSQPRPQRGPPPQAPRHSPGPAPPAGRGAARRGVLRRPAAGCPAGRRGSCGPRPGRRRLCPPPPPPPPGRGGGAARPPERRGGAPARAAPRVRRRARGSGLFSAGAATSREAFGNWASSREPRGP